MKYIYSMGIGATALEMLLTRHLIAIPVFIVIAYKLEIKLNDFNG